MEKPTPRSQPFTMDSVRVLKDAAEDASYPELDPRRDLGLLIAFLDRFDRLGWLPPLTAQKRRLLEQYGVIMHEVTQSACFYEFCCQGIRGEREPWLTVFFHVSETDRVVRICGVHRTIQVSGRRRAAVLDHVKGRVAKLIRAGRRRSDGNKE